MYDHYFFEPPRRGWLGASEYQDVDPKRLGMYGLSSGGNPTALALARNSDIFAAGVDRASVHAWPGLFDALDGARIGTEQQRAVALAASPLANIAKWKSPVLLDQGDDDPEVPFSQTVTLANLLEARGVDVTHTRCPTNGTSTTCTRTSSTDLPEPPTSYVRGSRHRNGRRGRTLAKPRARSPWP